MGFHAWILKLVHLLLVLARCAWRMRSKISGAARSLTGGKPLLMQQLAAAQLKKPHHLGVIILEERVSYADLASIVVWSQTYGISCVSLYNPAGSSDLDATRLDTAIGRAATKAGCSSHYSVHAVDYCSEKSSLVVTHGQYEAANGCMDGGRSQVTSLNGDGCSAAAAAMRVLLLPHCDGGHGLLVAAARARGQAMALARRLRRRAQSGGGGHGGSGDTAAADVSTPESLLEAELTSRLPVSCPEAVLQFGDTASLCGYLPWHVRLTEIFTLVTHVDLRQQEFLRIMQLYGSTEQRHGT